MTLWSLIVSYEVRDFLEVRDLELVREVRVYFQLWVCICMYVFFIMALQCYNLKEHTYAINKINNLALKSVK